MRELDEGSRPSGESDSGESVEPAARSGSSWSEPAAISTYLCARALGLVSLVAFVSLHVQLDGLFGSEGLAPLAPRLARLDVWQAPSLLFVTGASDHALHGLVVLGELGSIGLAVGVLPGLSALVAWACYASFLDLGWPFLPLQWDTLLSESLILAAVASPWDRAWISPRALPQGHVLPRVAIAFLACRLHVASGLVKLLSGDSTWADLSALEHHFETEPLPTPLAPFVHALPPFVLAMMVLAVYALEIVLPLAAIVRRARIGVVAGLVALQLAIVLTGNFGFFNALSALLTLPLLDDAQLARGLARLRARFVVEREASRGRAVSSVLAVALMLSGALDLYATVGGMLPEPIAAARASLSRLHLTSEYGPFGVMTTVRREIVLEVSEDGRVWTELSFPYNPGDPARGLPIVPLHMPRLDWMLWFAALGEPDDAPWLLGLERALLDDRPAVRALLDAPPPIGRIRLVRAVRYRYRYARDGEHVWIRDEREPFGPTLTRR
ncbi:MAG: lipase maturation factor family protein [Sandaracinus sp.]